jgi:predicted AAA+ superfamily ATPase
MTQGPVAKRPLRSSFEGPLRGANPWWGQAPSRPLPPFRRHAFNLLLRHFREGLAPGVMLRGPRQVGKTTLQEQIIDHLLRGEGVNPNRILRVQFDDLPFFRRLETPILFIAEWFQDQVLAQTFNSAAKENHPAYLLFDEVQNLPNWAPQIKHLVDHNAVRVMITGSSALRIRAGQDSLAGRVNDLELGPLSLREIGELRYQAVIPAVKSENEVVRLKEIEFWKDLANLGEKYREPRDRAFSSFSERGAYPAAQINDRWSWEELADFLTKTVVQRAVIHDLRLGDRGRRRDQQLLEQVFLLACRYAGQAPGPSVMMQQVNKVLQSDASWQTIRNYLRFLDDTLLLKLIPPLELRLRKTKGQDKICLCDPMIRSAWLREPVPLEPKKLAESPHLSDLAGHLAESTAGYFLASIVGGKTFSFPARANEPEVDFILIVGDQRIPVEIKYQNQITPSDTRGLLSFVDKTANHAPFGILITKDDGANITDPRIVVLPLSSLLLLQ